jgi:hypothetical protein
MKPVTQVGNLMLTYIVDIRRLSTARRLGAASACANDNQQAILFPAEWGNFCATLNGAIREADQ